MNFLLIVMMFLIQGHSAYELRGWTEVHPPTLQWDAMSADTVGQGGVMASDFKNIWTPGKSYMWQWNIETGAVKRWDASSDLPQKDVAKIGLFFRGRDLFASSDRLVYTAKAPIKGIKKVTGFWIVWTAQAIIVFNENYERQQVIPVLGNRQIDAFGASDGVHVIAFNDGSIEIMELVLQKKIAISPEKSGLLHHTNAQIFVDPEGKKIIFIYDHEFPRVYYLN